MIMSLKRDITNETVHPYCSQWTVIVLLPSYKPEKMHIVSVSVHYDSVQRCMLISDDGSKIAASALPHHLQEKLQRKKSVKTPLGVFCNINIKTNKTINTIVID